MSLDAGVAGVYQEYAGLLETMKVIRDTIGGTSGATAAGLLKKISEPDFIGKLYLLKGMLSLLSA